MGATVWTYDPVHGVQSSQRGPRPTGYRAGSSAPSREAGGGARMRIAILGATGGTGIELVGQALERGHAVTAFVRDPAPSASSTA
jgi:hypothetical protein